MITASSEALQPLRESCSPPLLKSLIFFLLHNVSMRSFVCEVMHFLFPRKMNILLGNLIELIEFEVQKANFIFKCATCNLD